MQVVRQEQLKSIWSLALADCLVWLPTLADQSVDHVIMDPPYSDHTHKGCRIDAAPNIRGWPDLGFSALTEQVAHAVMREMARIAKRWILAFTDLENVRLWIDATKLAGLDYVRTCIWDKCNAFPQFSGDRPGTGIEAFVVAHRSGRKRWNAGGKLNVYRHSSSSCWRERRPHPAAKPDALMREIIADFTDPNDLILDPFAGSGSTLVAARALGRRAIGCEIDLQWFEVAVRRLRGEEAHPDPAQPSLFG